MYPINQVILNNGDSIEEQIKIMEAYRNRLNQLQQKSLIWDEIDKEVSGLNVEQREKLFQDEDYNSTYKEIQNITQSELLNLVKAKIENSAIGKELLEKQLVVVKKLKKRIIQESNIEMELFRKFKDFSKEHPEITYEEFIKKI